MDLVQGKSQHNVPHDLSYVTKGKTIEINPTFASNKPEVTDCTSGTCTTLPAQGANFVYLRTAPRTDASLLSNTYLHPDGSPGSTQHSDWSAKATDGQQFVVADVQGDWTGIWYDGKIGWLYNPHGQNARVVHGKTVKARAGLATVPVYVTAYPEASAYPSDVPPAPQNKLYEMPKDQQYTVLSANNPTDYFYDATINFSKPHDHEIFKGKDKYVQISYNHRVAYVNAKDVVLK